MVLKSYPGEGDEWADFLHHRHRLILRWRTEGREPAEIAKTLSMDPIQVALIGLSPLGEDAEDHAHA
jgi:hypothetical protein